MRCPACGSLECLPAGLEGSGRVLAFTLVHSDIRQPSPWRLVLVETDDGLHMTGFADQPLDIGAEVRVASVKGGVPTFEREGS